MQEERRFKREEDLEILIRIDERTKQIEIDCANYRQDIKELYGKVDELNKEGTPATRSVQRELTEHKSNHWQFAALVVGSSGILITIIIFIAEKMVK